MIRLVRILGFLLIAVGAIILLSYLIEPLRAIWPWFRSLDWPIQVGLGLAAVGLLVLLASVIWERWEDYEKERKIKDRL